MATTNPIRWAPSSARALTPAGGLRLLNRELGGISNDINVAFMLTQGTMFDVASLTHRPRMLHTLADHLVARGLLVELTADKHLLVFKNAVAKAAYLGLP